MKDKKWLILSGIFALFLFSTLFLYFFKKENEWNVGLSNDVEVEKMEFLSNHTVLELVKDDIVLLDNFELDTKSLGEKRVEFKYRLKDEKRVRNGFYIYEVIDTEKPVIFGRSSYTTTVGSKVDLLNIFISGDMCDDTPIRRIEGEYSLNDVGSYPLTYVIEDKSGNIATYDFTLKVVKPSTSGGGSSTSSTKISFSDVINKHKTTDTMIGIDVSKWQGNIDWEKVKNAGSEFAIIRIGHQKGIKGEYIIDPYFKQNLENAKKNNIPVGVYFYSYADSVDEAKKQAEWIIEQLDGETLELGISYDWESFSLYNSINLSFYNFSNARDMFLKTVEKHGYKGMLYSSKYYLENIWLPLEYDTWLAHYTSSTNYKGEYYLWQMCNTGRIDGISGDVDINILYKNRKNVD